MKKKAVTNFYRALPLGLLLCLLMGTAPAFGQGDDSLAFGQVDESLLVERGFRASALVGPCFHSGATRDSCPFFVVQLEWTGSYDNDDQNNQSNFLRFKPGSFLPMRVFGGKGGPTGVNVTGTVAYGSSDMIPDPDCPPGGCENGRNALLAKQSAKAGGHSAIAEDSLQRSVAHHRGTMIGLLEFGLPIPIEPKFLAQPFVGFGYAYVREGKAKAPNRYAVARQGMAALSYGLGVSARINKRVDLLFQYRTTVFFTGELKYIDAEDRRFEEEVSTVTTSSLLFGIGYRFPNPRKKKDRSPER